MSAITHLKQPKVVSIECVDGSTKDFVISKFPAIAGREIITQYPLSSLPKIGDYKTNEALMMKIMGYVGVPESGDAPAYLLNSAAMIDNHVPDHECLLRLEFAIIEYNCSFFRNGKAQNMLQSLTGVAQQFLTKTLTDLLRQSSAPAKQP